MNEVRNNSPIVIGGVGGSGTRVIADILMRIGIYLGSTLNQSLDNLWFTVLFKHFDWFKNGKREREATTKKGLDIFTNAMVGKSASSDDMHGCVKDYIKIIRKDAHAKKEVECYFKNWRNFIQDIVFSKKLVIHEFTGWGWKEPNSHIYLEDLAKYYSNMRYIHVIRHGLDMAFSNNQNQVRLWGKLFEIDNADDPISSFRFWLKANEKAICLGEKILADRFLILNFENLCNAPEREIRRLIDFLQLSVSNEVLDQVAQIPSPPSSIGRYKKYDTSWMNSDDITSLNMIGYEY